jgi:hypothetical protein
MNKTVKPRVWYDSRYSSWAGTNAAGLTQWHASWEFAMAHAVGKMALLWEGLLCRRPRLSIWPSCSVSEHELPSGHDVHIGAHA